MSSIIGNAIIVPVTQLKVDKILNNNTWEIIKQVSDKSQGQNYWSVGDCKEVTMNGMVSESLTLSNYSAWVFIIGFNHNSVREGNGIAFQGFKATKNGTPVCLVDSYYGNSDKTTSTVFRMNESTTNNGGWASSQMRQNVMPLIKASFPADLQAVIKTSTIFTDNTGGINPAAELTATQDEVFLLAEYEVFGYDASNGASAQEQTYLKQYAYYSAGNSKVKYKHNSTGSAAIWLERSPWSASSSSFCGVTTNGSSTYINARASYGVSPAFKV